MKAVTYLVVLTFGTASAGLRAAQPIWASAALVLFTVLAFAGASRGAEPRERWGPNELGGTAGFGFAMHAAGDLLVIGAPRDDERGTDAGAVYVYRRLTDSTWASEAKLTASDAGAGHRFGQSVASSGDRLLVGAPYHGPYDDGAAYVFRLVSGSWIQESKLTTPAAEFGWSVGISGDWAVVSSIESSGRGHVFHRDASGWTKVQELQDAQGTTPFAGTVSVAGDLAVTTSTACGIGPCGFGNVYRRSGDGYAFETALAAPDGAILDAVAVAGNVVVLGADASGAAYVFRHGDGGWQFDGKLMAFDGMSEEFGIGVAIAGDLIVVRNSAAEASAAYTFRWEGVAWRPEGILTGVEGGIAVGAAGDDAIVGSWLADAHGVVDLFGGACANAVDDDGDGLSDAADPGCDAPADLTEDSPLLACDDAVDDDGDGRVDLADPGCEGLLDPSELGPILICSNGLDDDGDGLVDFAEDPGCNAPDDVDGSEEDVDAHIVVTSEADDLTPGDGLCTLREAVDNANRHTDATGGDCAPGGAADLIELSAGSYPGGIWLSGDVTIRGAGADRTSIVGFGSDIWGRGVRADAGRVSIEALGLRAGPIGLLNEGASVRLADAVVSDHEGAPFFSGWLGGGIVQWAGDLTVQRSAIVRNVPGISAAGTSVRIENSTVSENLGPILRLLGYAWDYRLPAAIEADSLEIHDSTVADNCNGCGPVDGRAYPVVSAYLVAGSTILANPGSGNLNCGLEVASLGHNIDSDGSCGFDDPTDLSNLDPLLGPLQDNGGPTPTHALLPGSPAIDAIPLAACYDHDADQRGVARPQGSACDIGALEVTACGDGLDNDGDGFTDYPADPACRSAASTRERTQCQDGVNNDGRTGIDFDGGASLNGGVPLDVPDPQCTAAWKNKEAAGGCGLGFELALVLPVLGWLRRRAGSA